MKGHYHGTNTSYRFQLIIDGCNGPIRFRENKLRRSTETAITVAEGGADDIDGGGAKDVSSGNRSHGDGCDDDNDDNETILSFLRPESIILDKQKNQLRNSSRSKKNARCRKKKQQIPKTRTYDNTKSVEESPNRLDMIPLLEKLLQSSSHSKKDSDLDERKLFDSISVVFDGISITKRPTVPISSQNEDDKQEGEKEIEEKIVRGRIWHVQRSDAANATKASIRCESSIHKSLDKSGGLRIEITGLYDEADNVIVERVQEHHRRNIDREKSQSPTGVPDHTISTTRDERGHLAVITRIRILRRTERGAGKNRRLFQSLGLLRPESVACVFEFGLQHKSTSSDNDSGEGREEVETGYSDRHLQSRGGDSSFLGLALECNQSLRSLRRQNPGNVFLTREELSEFPHPLTGEKEVHAVVPIVATDDVFLRQRIVHEGGYVMTFHQLWILLLDAK